MAANAQATEEKVIWQPQDREDGSPGPQRLLITCPADVLLFGGARGGGKSDCILGDWLGHVAENPGYANGIIFRQTLPELEELIERAKQLFLPIGARWKEQKKRFIFPGGATLVFKYLKRLSDIQRYQGKQLTWVGIEEAGNWPTDLMPDGTPTNKAFRMLMASMRSAHGVKTRMVLTANPGGEGHDWLKQEFRISKVEPYEMWQDPVSKTWRVFIPSLLEDNRILMQQDPDYEDKLMAVGSPRLVRAWRFGDWNITPEGSVFHEEDFVFDLDLEAPPAFISIFDVWDTAFKKNQDSDYNAGVKFGATKTDLYVLDFVKRKMEYPEARRTIISFADSYMEKQGKGPGKTRRSMEVCIEDKASGQSLIQDLRRETQLNVVGIKVLPGDDKESRAHTTTSFVHAKRVHFPKPGQVPWLKTMIDDLISFPASGRDTTDAFVHGCRRFMEGFAGKGVLDYYREEAERLKKQTEA